MKPTIIDYENPYPDYWVRKAKFFINRDKEADLERAKYCMKKAAELGSDEPEVYLWLADWEDFRQNIEKALELDPENPKYIAEKAEHLLDDDLEEESEDLIDKSLEKFPNNAQLISAKIEFLKHKIEDLLEKIQPEDNVTSLLETARLLHEHREHGCGIENRILSYIDQALALEPENKTIWLEKYYYYTLWGWYEAAKTIPDEKLTFERELSVLDFCITGQLGEVKLGMTQYEVFSILGMPDDRWLSYYEHIGKKSPKGHTPISIFESLRWYYATFELYFNEQRILDYMSFKGVELFKVDPRDKLTKIDPWFFRIPENSIVFAYVKYHDLIVNLHASNIFFEDTSLLSFPNSDDLCIGFITIKSSGVQFIYETDDVNSGELIVSRMTKAEFDDFAYLKKQAK